jgi:hypothetical protein
MSGGGLMPVLDSGIILRRVDQTEYVVNKLRDRGTHQAFGVVTNAQDFMHVLRFYVERWEQANLA